MRSPSSYASAVMPGWRNSIKAPRDTGLDRMPFASFAANQVWLELVLAGTDLLAWLRLGCLDGALAQAEPKALRYRLLHVAAPIVRRGRRLVLRLLSTGHGRSSWLALRAPRHARLIAPAPGLRRSAGP